MKTIFLSVFILINSIFQQTTNRADLCGLLQKKIEAKSQHNKPDKINCDKYGNIVFYFDNPDSPNQKGVFNLFETHTKIEQIEWANGQKPYKLTIYCKSNCISLLNWWENDKNIYSDNWEFEFLNKEDANYVAKCLANLKLKCIRDPNK